ncbi:transposase (plasmid) [Edwardsiella tarda ATCC 15947 = NBRC 105688]|uniref:Transposase n=1 Tax=Edwardsiella tarda ATCC 15947 = NBRC 105688 TaxID=667121 RepID=A0AC61TN32_EDWTA|nr:transposase [Edwardsiella tarda]UAL58117.1 transposase [Edwardsiella tarda]UCQ02022.1 transposase [Edwardsiella tarda ATCC 15947 = NBRC 105688]
MGIIRIKLRLKAVLADKGYSGKNIRIYMKEKGIKVVIPEKVSCDNHRTPDRQLYKKT